MTVPPTKTRGYLLIELGISLAAVALFSLLIARLQVQLMHQQYEAERYLKAVTAAHHAFEEQIWVRQEYEGYVIETAIRPLEDRLPYKQVVVTVSWKTAGGNLKKIVIHGGMLDETRSI